ncbi:MAG: Maf family nucleotide pyrophosphatase [Gammaproteobacteria bacterium]
MTVSPHIVLASGSRYRRELLQRLGIPFETLSPEVDETRQAGESAQVLVQRLSAAKAFAGGRRHNTAWVIGSDQVAVIDDEILGKPGSHARAKSQLRRLSGERVTFLTGLCLLDAASGNMQSDVIPFHVVFRKLDDDQIERYLRYEQPYDCAGSFRSEGRGIALFARMEGDDPTALIGLPLIRLTEMLTKAGVILP